MHNIKHSNINHKRRRMLLAISQLALMSGLAACSRGEQAVSSAEIVTSGDTDLELLASVAYDLFPYEELPAELYVRIARNLLDVNNPSMNQGLQQLRSAAGNVAWKDVAESRRVDILQEMENTAFFAAIRAASIEVLYRSEAVFGMVGYGGSAVEQGGYLNRGFDEIDWLPGG